METLFLSLLEKGLLTLIPGLVEVLVHAIQGDTHPDADAWMRDIPALAGVLDQIKAQEGRAFDVIHAMLWNDDSAVEIMKRRVAQLKFKLTHT